MLELTSPIAITLEAQQWNTVLAMLTDGPYKLAAPLIKAITDQAAAAAQESPSAAALNGGPELAAERRVS